MPNSVERFLGLAFASADLLVELNSHGEATFAAGAARTVSGRPESEIVGRHWRELVAEADHPMVEALLDTLVDGARRGPVTIAMASSGDGPTRAALSVCRLTAGANISLALSVASAVCAASDAEVDSTGFQSRASFESVAQDLMTAARAVGQELDFALVDTPGLANALKQAGSERAKKIVCRFAGALRAESFGGAPAARLSDERYAVVRAKSLPPDLFDQRVSGVLAASGVSAKSVVLTVDTEGQSLERSMRALSYAMDQFQAGGVETLGAVSLTEAFNQSLQNTLAKAGAIGEAIKEHRFTLAYQPIVDLKSGQVKHYETLVRFSEDASPFELIRMAEELALIEQLDLAVAGKAFAKIHAERAKNLKLAVNVSGRSIEDPGFITEFRRITAHQPQLISRLVIEVTESVQIKDLKLANRNIQRLRADGHSVCLDDFGAGSASMSYLQSLQVDVVKIDGRYVRELCGDGREGALVRHLVALCKELGVTTIAEMIESEAIEEAARKAGADCGQGYLYGRPGSEPKPPPQRSPPVIARRRGVVESWG